MSSYHPFLPHRAAACVWPILGALSLGMVLSAPVTLAQDAFELPATWGYASDANDSNAPGFAGRLAQARGNAGLTATIARGNAHLSGSLIDPNSEKPYVNLATTDANKPAGWEGTDTIREDGSFTVAGVINFSNDGSGFPLDDGNFGELEGNGSDRLFPGIPGSDDDSLQSFANGQNFSVEFNGYLALPAGDVVLGIRHDDAVEVALHPNDARDLFRQQVIGFDSNSGKADRTKAIQVAEAGLYSVRVLLAQWNGDATLEFYSVDPNDESALTLINDSADGAIKAWRSLAMPGRPYVTAVSPAINATGVERNTAISATFENLGDEKPVLKVNGTEVSYATTTDGTASTISFSPIAPFEAGQTVMVELAYGEASSSWTFVAKSGRKALLITGGGQLNAADGWVANRLGSKFGFDVAVVGDGAVKIEDAEGAGLIFNSSTVNSGMVADDQFETLPIPLINVESANVDDFIMSDEPFAFGNGPNSGVNSVIITDEPHPISAGIDPGEHEWSSAQVQYHWGKPPVNSTAIGIAPNNEAHAIIYAIEEGAEILNEAEDVVFTHPARRVYFGMTGNDGAASYTELGTQLFDAVVTWALGTPVRDDSVPEFLGFAIEGDQVSLDFSKIEAERQYVLQRASNLQDWTDVEDAVLEDLGESLRLSATRSDDPAGQFRIAVIPPPALFFDDFESGANGWETEIQSGDTTWELGTPAVASLSTANSGSNAYGTNLDGGYGNNERTNLTSPVVDLTDVRRASLSFSYFVDTTEGSEGVQVRFLNENGDQLAFLDDIFWGQSAGWTSFSARLPDEAQGKKVRVQWALLTDGDEPNGAGFYLDDVLIDD